MSSLLRQSLPSFVRTVNHAPIASRSFILPSLSSLANAAASAASAASTSSSGSGTSPGSDGDDGLQTYHERKILPYDRRQLYNLVLDIPSYPRFIPYCTNAKIVSAPIRRPRPRPSSSSSTSTSDAARAVEEEEEQAWETELEAELEVGFMGVQERYISCVTGKPFESVQAIATSQIPLFKSLTTTWSFSPASPSSPHPTPSSPSRPTSLPSTMSPADPDTLAGPTLLTIDLAYRFANPLHAVLAKAFFDRVSGKMVDAFERRCLEVYGPGKV